MPATKRTERTTRETRSARPDRIPVGGYRDKLTVRFKDEHHGKKFASRWCLDSSHQGGSIVRYLDAGYEFVPYDEVQVGQTYVFNSDDVGSIVRVPADKEGNYLYLMRLPIEYYNDDLAAKNRQINESERALAAPDQLREDADSVYGKIKIEHNQSEE